MDRTKDTTAPGLTDASELLGTLRAARAQAQAFGTDPRERAILVRYIEDAICRLEAARLGALR